MYLSNTIKTEIVTITPTIAAELLKQNTRNRKVSSVNYHKVLEAMSAGEWELNGEAIKIARDGQILDGQHRLMVSAENDITFTTLIVYGLESDTQDTMDTGKSRTIADVLSINGYKHATALASVVAGILRWERWGLRVASYQGTTSYQVTAKQVIARVEDEPSLVDMIPQILGLRKAGLSIKVAGILYYVFSSIDQDDADDFFAKLETGAGLDRGNPILALRETLLRLRTSVKGQVSSGYAAALTIKAWNKYRSGEEIVNLRFTPGGANPEKFPEPI